MGRRARRRGERPAAQAPPVPMQPVPQPERTGPVIALGAPVAERGWILPQWFECLAKQTLQPRYLRFVYTTSNDDTYLQLVEGANRMPQLKGLGGLGVRRTKLGYFTRGERNADPADPHRAHHLSALRNELRHEFLRTPADVFVSLDTDILLEDPTILEQMVAELYGPRAENPRAEWGWDVVNATVSLHQTAKDCYNAGRWMAGMPGDPKRVWERCTETDVIVAKAKGEHTPVRIHTPMAVFAARRWVWQCCEYKFHEQGEDLGFGDALDQRGFRVCWRPDLWCRHVMDPTQLEVAA